MEWHVTAQDVGTIVTFFAPGYFARMLYRAKFSIKEPSNTHLTITSVAYSLPLVAITAALVNFINWLLRRKLGHLYKYHLVIHPIDPTYVAILTIVAFAGGFLAIKFREHEKTKNWARNHGFLDPETDLYQKVFYDYLYQQRVTVTLKEGKVFRGYVADLRSQDGLTKPAIYFRGVEWWSSLTSDFIPTEKEQVLLIALENVYFVESNRRI